MYDRVLYFAYDSSVQCTGFLVRDARKRKLDACQCSSRAGSCVVNCSALPRKKTFDEQQYTQAYGSVFGGLFASKCCRDVDETRLGPFLSICMSDKVLLLCTCLRQSESCLPLRIDCFCIECWSSKCYEHSFDCVAVSWRAGWHWRILGIGGMRAGPTL